MNELVHQTNRDLENRSASGSYIYAGTWMLIGFGTGFAESSSFIFYSLIFVFFVLGAIRLICRNVIGNLTVNRSNLRSLTIYLNALLPAFIMSCIYSASFVITVFQPLFFYLTLTLFALISGGIVVFSPSANLSLLYLITLISPPILTTLIFSSDYYLEATMLVVYGGFMYALSRRLVNEYKQLISQQNELIKLNSLDSLTGIANRRAFENTIELNWATHTRTKSHIALMLIDIDYFKNINDTFGHAAGDKIICCVAEKIESICKRRTDCVARIGGEEFAVILPMTTSCAAIKLAEEVRKQVESANVVIDGQSISCTVSIGLACCVPSQHNSSKALFKTADENLYKAKTDGRNKVIYEA